MKPSTQETDSVWIKQFANEDELFKAVQILLASDLLYWDVLSPYPCEASRLSSMRLRRNKNKGLSILGILGGCLGGLIVILWVYITQIRLSDNLINQGRHAGMESFIGYVPVVFEGILLGAGLLLTIGFFRASGLPEWQNQSGMATNGFFIVVDAAYENEIKNLLKAQQPQAVHNHSYREGEEIE